MSQQNSNLSKEEINALKSLRENKDIIIKPADKGSCTVVMNKTDYIAEGHRQLSNKRHYKKLDGPIYPKISEKISDILKELYLEGFIDKRQLEYLDVPNNPRERKFYLLPKIHKEKSKWTGNGRIPPGRPIVSDCDSDTYKIAEYIDHFLAPLAKSHDSYIKDTPDFLHKLSKVKTDPNSLLISLDIESLYTNIDNKDGIQAVKDLFRSNPDPNRPDDHILELLQLSLENNDFMFNGEWYLQTWGTAMGKKFAPNYANIFLANWEKEALGKCPKSPECYFRYLDDIFMIWSHGEEEFKNFFNILNNHHPTIKLKATVDKTSLNFLDVTVFKGIRFNTSKQLDTKVYFKPTDSHQLLHKHSYHPKHTYKGIVKSQIMRFHRICNNKTDFDNACTILFQSLRQRRYSSRFLRTIKSEFLNNLKPVAKSKKCEKQGCKTCPHILETTSITTSNNKTINIQHSLNCRSESAIYALQCTNCGLIYVGQTSNTINERLSGHRSDIKTKKQTVIAVHFNENCPNINFLRIIPLEHVEVTYSVYLPELPSLKYYAHLLQREQYWIKKLDARVPRGLNKRTDIPPPIPFIIKYSDQAGKIGKTAKQFYQAFQDLYNGVYKAYQIVTAYKRNKNLKDYLVSSTIKN